MGASSRAFLEMQESEAESYSEAIDFYSPRTVPKSSGILDRTADRYVDAVCGEHYVLFIENEVGRLDKDIFFKKAKMEKALSNLRRRNEYKYGKSYWKIENKKTGEITAV